MMIHLIAGLLFLYLLIRFIFPLPLKRGPKIAAAVLLLAVSQQHLLTRSLFGSLSSPEIPPALIAVQGWMFVSLLLLFLLVLARDLFLIGAWLFSAWLLGRKKSRDAFSPGRREALIAGLALIPSAYGVYKGISLPEVHRMEIRQPKLPAELDGLSIVQLSDIHVSPLFRREWVASVVERVNALKPDLILLTGDMVDGLPARRAESVAPLGRLKSRFGTFGCAGNHEYYSDYPAWMQTFPKLGITMLLNSHTQIIMGKHIVVLAGVTDMVAERFGLPLPDCEKALAGAPQDALRILMDHRPGAAPDNAAHNVDLQLSGHTHGGQILGMNALVARFNGGFVQGWYTLDAMQMYVSSGAGLWNGFPVRLGVPSEIPHIVLRSH